jgi:hypothetical protein
MRGLRRIALVILEAGQEYAFSSGILTFSVHPTPGATYDFTETGIGAPGKTAIGLTVPFSAPAVTPLESTPDYPMKIKAVGGQVIVTILTAN